MITKEQIQNDPALSAMLALNLVAVMELAERDNGRVEGYGGVGSGQGLMP